MTEIVLPGLCCLLKFSFLLFCLLLKKRRGGVRKVDVKDMSRMNISNVLIGITEIRVSTHVGEILIRDSFYKEMEFFSVYSLRSETGKRKIEKTITSTKLPGQ